MYDELAEAADAYLVLLGVYPINFLVLGFLVTFFYRFALVFISHPVGIKTVVTSEQIAGGSVSNVLHVLGPAETDLALLVAS